MATGSAQHYKARIDFRRRGNVPAPRFRLAVRQVLRERAEPLLRLTRQIASAKVKNSPSLTNRGSRRYAKTMVDSYEANVLSDGKTISLTNPTLRGRIFELGSHAHWITPKRGGYLYFPARRGGTYQRRGRAAASTRSYQAGDLIRVREVQHPGTQAQYPMREALNRMRPELGRGLKDSINRELRGRG